MSNIKAIIPAAGFGTRFLPATKAVPKELLPILDKPAIQYVIEEGLNSGIKDFVIVTPGVRVDEKKNDQKRTITPKEAIEKGATYIVLGRAVRDHQDPKGLLGRISEDIKNAITDK